MLDQKVLATAVQYLPYMPREVLAHDGLHMGDSTVLFAIRAEEINELSMRGSFRVRQKVQWVVH